MAAATHSEQVDALLEGNSEGRPQVLYGLKGVLLGDDLELVLKPRGRGAWRGGEWGWGEGVVKIGCPERAEMERRNKNIINRKIHKKVKKVQLMSDVPVSDTIENESEQIAHHLR